MRGLKHDAVVIGWRGQQAYLRWKSELGNHLGWVPAADVERVDAQPAPRTAQRRG